MSDVVWVAIVAAMAPTGTVVLAWWQQHKQLTQVHQIVNSRLDQALAKISELEKELYHLRAELKRRPPTRKKVT